MSATLGRINSPDSLASKLMVTLEDLPEECGLAVRDLLALACMCRRFAHLVQVRFLPVRMGQDAWYIFGAQRCFPVIHTNTCRIFLLC